MASFLLLVLSTPLMASQPDSREHGDAGASSGASFNPGVWTCQYCDEVNSARRRRCNGCSRPHPSSCTLGSGAWFNPRVWTCHDCDEVNSGGRKRCNGCQALQHLPPIAVTSTPSSTSASSEARLVHGPNAQPQPNATDELTTRNNLVAQTLATMAGAVMQAHGLGALDTPLSMSDGSEEGEAAGEELPPAKRKRQ